MNLPKHAALVALAAVHTFSLGCADDAGAAGGSGGETSTATTTQGSGSSGTQSGGGDGDTSSATQSGPSGSGGGDATSGSQSGPAGTGGGDATTGSQSGPSGTGGAGPGSGPGGGGGSSDASAGSGGEGGSYQRQNLLLEAGFEGNDPWAGFVNQQHCCDHSVTQSSQQARTGSSAFRAEVREDDPAVSSGYRAELTLDDISDTGDKWYGWSTYFETPTDGDEWVGTNGHFVQWHPDNGGGSASLGLWSYGDGWLVGLNPEGDGGADFEELGFAIEANRWHDIVMHVNWDDGIVQVWLNGVLEVDRDDVDYASGPGQYMKLGINRWGGGPNGSPDSGDWVIFYDDLRIGNENATYADVAP
jgi:hypothetical protein